VKNCAEFIHLNGFELERWETQALLLAALWHDWGHSGGLRDDGANVEFAVSQYLELRPENWRFKHLDDQVVAAIRCTEFRDGKFTREPQTLIQKVLRDADVLQILEPNWLDQVVGGLCAEFIRAGKPVTWEQMCSGQVKFRSETVRFHTVWGRAKRVSVQERLHTLRRVGHGTPLTSLAS
jgi:hypothetical protein